MSAEAPTPRERVRVRSHLTRNLRVAVAALIAAGLSITGLAIITPAVAAPTTTGIFSDQLKPTVAVDPDRVPVELGIRFSPERSGSVTALQYYQGSATTDVTSATLWSADGTVLARASFPADRTVGWRTVALDNPVKLSAGKRYVASYQAPEGAYPVREQDLVRSKTQNGFRIDSSAGVYRYGATSSVPQSTYRGSNYLVDIVFAASGDAKPLPSSSPTPSTSPTPKPTATPTPKPTATPTPTPTPTPTSTPTPTATPTPTPSATSAPATPGSCVGAANTPGGPDPWGGCWPGPQNTGYPQGLPGDSRKPVTLTTYTGPTTIRSCGVVIDSKIVNESIIIEAGNGTTSKSTPCVTIRNSLVKGVIFAEKSSYGPVLIEDTEVAPPDLPWWENIGRSNFFAYRVNSHGGEGVIKCDTNCEAKDNWVHGMELGGAYHYNAFGGNGTDGFRIEHNYATCGDWSAYSSRVEDAGCSAVIGFYGDYGPIQNITITKNYLASTFDMSDAGKHTQAGYCLNPGYYPGKPYPNTRNLTVTDNVFARGGSGKCGVYGPTNSLNKAGAPNGNVWSNNRFSDGAAIGRPEE